MSKYNAKKTKVDGIKFDSKAEAEYYKLLKQQKAKGEILDFDTQVKFELQGAYKHPVTSKRIQAITYKADFVITWMDGQKTVVDVKGAETAVFKLKKKMFEKKYNMALVIVKYDYRRGIFYEV